MRPADLVGLPAALAQEVDVDGLTDAIDTGGLDAVDWITAGIIAVVAVVGAVVASRLVSRLMQRRGTESLVGDLVGRLAAYVIVAIGLVYALAVLGVRIAPLLGALGIAGIALAFALRDILENFVAGLLLQIRRPFDKGDQIVTGEIEGTVREVNARSVVIDTPDAEQVVVPSAELINQPIVNLTAHPVRRTTLEVGVAYATDLDRAKEVIEAALADVEGVAAQPAPETRVFQFGESSIDIAVRYWHEPRIATMWRVRDEVARAVKRSFDEAGIEIPFPQRVLWTGDGGGA